MSETTVANESALKITPSLLREARIDAARTNLRMVEILEEKTGLAPPEFVMALAHTLNYPVLSMEDLNRLTPAFDILPFTLAQQKDCIAFRDHEGKLLLAIGDPYNQTVQDWVEETIRVPFAGYLAHYADLAACLTQQEESLRAMDGVLGEENKETGSRSGIEDLSLKAISEDTSPVVKLVRSTLYDALKMGTSDIHLEKTPTGLAIRYRIDGVLTTVGEISGSDLAEQVISRIKVMSELDISERRTPQDGRFKVSAQGRDVDCRVSIMPSIFGEDAVLRILDKEALSDHMRGLRLDYIGFDADSLTRLRRLCNEPYGMVLVTGPTGSGKTTTIYAAISEINHGLDKIITIEDPVEYQLPGVLQIPVNEKKGLTFARGLRSILRHDPDKIMVGEIRDSETAQIAVQAALTGHLVFTTVHANNVFDVIGRFLHMQVDPYNFVAAMNGILAQRLVRMSCPHCAEPVQPDQELLALSGLADMDVTSYRFKAGKGCGQCRGSGYKGRRAIGELLNLNDEIREMIVAREPIRHLKEAARRNGTRFLRDAALDLVATGETTLQEINRVTFVA
ncbi:type II secretion system protein E [Sulfuricella denitrificans skB26]|uniref:Type II secretion system protein E n=1 Tax=Sulfuricella denitrificans (strain DSM 22764 / NBRC 105220 / skB26) TaxID=1163617 RepID=S6ADN6_SULDS|nr:GspE/PulE family protein [Sulfuricella denitrificans]BAN36608.1 type II secretion system protein E [Sulfuricella denitrificans skB26]